VAVSKDGPQYRFVIPGTSNDRFPSTASGPAEKVLSASPGGSRRFRQHIEMTREPLTVPGGPKLRLLAPAAIEHEWTPGVEAASAGWVDRARHVALQDHRGADGAGLRHRHG
jgi:hypothetical protein